jgi:hypothetical protein
MAENMAENPPTTPPARTTNRSDLTDWLGRIGVLATVLTALILTAVLLGNLLLLALGVASTPLLVAIVDLGPVLGLFFGNIATGVSYYGTWRILRGRDRYDVKGDAKSQLLGAPGALQGVPGELRGLFGCAPLISTGLLVGSLILSALTIAPLHVLGVPLQASRPAGSGSPPTPGNTSLTPTSTPLPTPVPRVQVVVGPAATRQQCHAQSTVLPAVAITLDNTGSTVDVSWQMGDIQRIASTGELWASASAAGGVIPAGGSADLALTPHPRLCALNPQPRAVYFATIQLATGGSDAILDTVISAPISAPPAPPPPPTATPTPTPTPTPSPTPSPTPPPGPHVALSVRPANQSQACGGSSLAYRVTLDNTESNVPVAWAFAASDHVQPGSALWATASPPSGAVSAGQITQFTLAPDPGVCSVVGTTTYHATIGVTSLDGKTTYATLSLTDSVGVPVRVHFRAEPESEAQVCGTSSFGPYRLTLDNSGSTVPVAWSLGAFDHIPGSNTPWATASTYSGTLQPHGGHTILSLTPAASLCDRHAGTYHATISVKSLNGGTTYATVTLTYTVSVPGD